MSQDGNLALPSKICTCCADAHSKHIPEKSHETTACKNASEGSNTLPITIMIGDRIMRRGAFAAAIGQEKFSQLDFEQKAWLLDALNNADKKANQEKMQ
jgi:hypothetical protein